MSNGVLLLLRDACGFMPLVGGVEKKKDLLQRLYSGACTRIELRELFTST